MYRICYSIMLILCLCSIFFFPLFFFNNKSPLNSDPCCVGRTNDHKWTESTQTQVEGSQRYGGSCDADSNLLSYRFHLLVLWRSKQADRINLYHIYSQIVTIQSYKCMFFFPYAQACRLEWASWTVSKKTPHRVKYIMYYAISVA